MNKKRIGVSLLALMVAMSMPIYAFAKTTTEAEGTVETKNEVVNVTEGNNTVIETQSPEGATEQKTESSTVDADDSENVVSNEKAEDIIVSDKVVEETEKEDTEQNSEEVTTPDTEGDMEVKEEVEIKPEDVPMTETVPTEEGSVEEQPTEQPTEQPGDELVTEVPVIEELPLEEVVVEEITTEEAIIVEEPVAATLTIVHRIVGGEENLDKIEIVNNLNVGDCVELKAYVIESTFVECKDYEVNFIIDEENDTTIIEYRSAEETENVISDLEV